MLQRFFSRPKQEKQARVLTTEDLRQLLLSINHSTSGVAVTPSSALQCAAVFAYVRVLSESLAQLPVILYRKRKDGGKDRVTDDPLYNLLQNQPNSWQTSFEWRELGMACLNLRGNSYGFINWTGSGNRKRILEILPLLNVTVKQNATWGLEYKATIGKESFSIPPGNMLHIRGLTLNGFEGISPITYEREAIGLAISAERHGARVFKHGARPGGVLSHPQTLSKDAAERIKESWEKAHGGEKQGGTAVLEEGMTYAPVSMTSKDAQYLETRKYQRSEIAAIFRVPPHMIADLEKATFSNIEHQSMEFAKFTLLPWARRWEQALWRDLLTDQQKKEGYFVEFLLDGLERADIKTRYEAYRTGIESGILNPNECRAKENLNAYEGGDTFIRPLNMAPTGEGKKFGAFTGRNSSQQNSIEARNELRESFNKKFMIAAHSLVLMETNDIREQVEEHLSTKSAETLSDWLDTYYSEAPEVIKDTFRKLLSDYIKATGNASLLDVDREDLPDLEGFIEDYLQALSSRHVDSSLGQLKALIRDSEPSELEEVLNTRLNEWQETRPRKIASQEIIQASNAAARFVWAAAGVQTLKWVAQGSKNCPFCRQLNGKTVGILDPFIGKGESITASDGSGMKIYGKKLHAPIHKGCVCSIRPG